MASTHCRTIWTFGLVGALVAPMASAAPRWRIEVLPPLSTPAGELSTIKGLDLNERGQVAGTAEGPPGTSAAFRYTPGVGMEDLDPNGRYRSEVPIGGAMNEFGDVFGQVLVKNSPVREQEDVFLNRGDGSFDFLEQGKTAIVSRGFTTFGEQEYLPDSGHICGFAFRRLPSGGLEVRPYLYLPDTGWTDLSTLHPRFQEQSVFCKFTNQRGDLVFSISGPPAPDEEPPFGHQEAFVLRDGEITEIPTFGRLVTVPGPHNEAGMVPGVYVDAAGRERAYVWTPERGLVTIHPPFAQESYAAYVSDYSSVVVGALRMGRPRGEPYHDNVFTYSRSKGLRIAIDKQALSNLLRRYRLAFRGVDVWSVNNRGAIVGLVYFEGGGVGIPYYYSKTTGLVDLKAVVDSFDVDFRLTDGGVAAPTELNDRGDILLVGTTRSSPRRFATAILTVSNR
jgi:probable HAF family extracellular repeat protein